MGVLNLKACSGGIFYKGVDVKNEILKAAAQYMSERALAGDKWTHKVKVSGVGTIELDREPIEIGILKGD